jgi:hypothetical protein
MAAGVLLHPQQAIVCNFTVFQKDLRDRGTPLKFPSLNESFIFG